MSKPSFVYVTYINCTPQKVWDALLDGECVPLEVVAHGLERGPGVNVRAITDVHAGIVTDARETPRRG